MSDTCRERDLVLQHQALWKEMHQADYLVETHSVLAVTMSGAALAFGTSRIEIPAAIYGAIFLGMLVSIE